MVLVDALEFDAPKTKQLLGLFSAIGADGKILVLTDGPKENVYLSARNLPNVETRPFGQESVYDILWANVVVIEKAALDGAEPSEADRDAAAARDRGEPEVRSREREAADAQAERKKARRGHKKTAKPTAPKVQADTIAGGIDVATVKLPKVGDMSDFLAQFDSADDVKALQARDSRKTAQVHYDARLLELSGGADVQEKGDDA